MILRFFLMAAFWALPVVAPLAKDAEIAPVTLWMRIQADGTPTDVTCAPATSAALCAALTRAVSRWKFTPALREGVPFAIDIGLGLPLMAVQKGEGFAIRATGAFVSLRNAETDGGSVSLQSRRHTPPRYPVDELRQGKSANVIVEISREAGSFHPTITHIWIDGNVARDANPFAKATRIAVSSWELVAWPAEQLSVCLTVGFTTGKSPPPAASPDTRPCASKYVDGFTPPTLMTDPLTAAF